MPTKDNISTETKEVINELCDIILINGDVLDKNKRKQYIENYISKNIKLSGDNYEVRHVVQKKVVQYIDDCPSVQLFQFATDSKFHYYRKEFKEDYYSYWYSQKQSILDVEYPEVFEYVFDFIQESIDSHTLFRNFSIRTMDDAVNRAKREAEDAAQSAANSAMIAVEKAEKAADEAAEKAIKTVLKSDKITESISQKINEQMVYVTRKVSETSVTILGIFAGIVLAVVGGMFYSSSVMENLYHTNLDKLICIAALVGFIFFNLIVILFRYVERIRNSGCVLETNDTQEGTKRFFAWIKHHKIDILVVLVNIALICLLFLSYGKVNENNSIPQDTESTECVFLDETK